MNTGVLFKRAEDVTAKRLFLFILPTYLTSLFNTLYSIVDGVFVAHYVGTNSLAALNIVYPLVYVLTGIALMFAIGGSAISGLSIGAGRKEQAKKEMTVSFVMSIGTGIVISVFMLMFLPQILGFLGATDLTYKDAEIYGTIWIIGVPVVIGKELFSYFIRVDGSPHYSFMLAVSGGVTNIILDYIFIGPMKMGVKGAGLATVSGLLVSSLMGVLYFCKFSKHLKFSFRGLSMKSGLRCGFNGFSQFIDQLAMGITTTVFNRITLGITGEDGIAAVTIIMYLQYIFIGIYFGYSMGISPLMSYSYGEGNLPVCKKMEKYSYRFLGISPIFMYILCILVSAVSIPFFAPEGTVVYKMAMSGMYIYGLGFMFNGFNIFSSIRLTAYGRGNIATAITFLRSFALLLLFLAILPALWGMTGVWLAMPVAECTTVFFAIIIAYKTRIKT